MISFRLKRFRGGWSSGIYSGKNKTMYASRATKAKGALWFCLKVFSLRNIINAIKEEYERKDK